MRLKEFVFVSVHLIVKTFSLPYFAIGFFFCAAVTAEHPIALRNQHEIQAEAPKHI